MRLVNPGGGRACRRRRYGWCGLALVAYLIALAGQLALIRLALGPSVTVGAAIAHGGKRLPIYLRGVLMIVFALLIVLIVIGLALGAMGVPCDAR